jgi:hypothetical protein
MVMTFNVPAIGATSLGIVVGWLVRYFVPRFETFTPAVLSSVLTIGLGGAAIRFLETDKTVWWFYPIGMVIAFVAYQILAMIVVREDRKASIKFPLSNFDKHDPRTFK